MANSNRHLHVIHKIRSGSSVANTLPPPPEGGRKLVRVWTLMDEDKLGDLGPVHNKSAFLEDHVHDWRLDKSGSLHYYSRVVPTGEDVEVVLDYETNEERQARERAAMNFDPETGRPISRSAKP